MTNWEKLFSTPEKTIQTIKARNDACVKYGCERCPFGKSVCPDSFETDRLAGSRMLAWLESEVRDDED